MPNRATGHAHGVGDGANAHEWASRLAEMFDTHELFGFVLTLPIEPEPHVARLMQTLGVPIEVVAVTTVAINGLNRCPHATEGCDWTYGGTALRAEKFLERHLATAHAPGDQVARVHIRPVEEPTEPQSPSSPGTSAVAGVVAASDVGRGTQAARVDGTKKRGGRRPKWTRETIVAALQEYAAAHDGQAPMTTAWQMADPSRPSYSNVQYVFGSWAKALAAAGLRNHRLRRRRVEELGRPGVGNSAVTGSAASTSGEDAEGHAALRPPVRPDAPSKDTEDTNAGPRAEPSPAIEPLPSPVTSAVSLHIPKPEASYFGIVALLLEECTPEELDDMLVEAIYRAEQLGRAAESARGEALILTIALERATELAA